MAGSCVHYLFGHETGVPIQHNIKDLHPSCKTDLNSRDCIERENPILLLYYTNWFTHLR